jgi:acetyl esterase/lipase
MMHDVRRHRFPAAKLIPVLCTLLASAGCTRFELLDAAVPSCGYLRTNNIAYGDEPRQKLDVYRPNTAKAPASVVVFFYGGDWQAGSKSGYRFVAQALASQGFIVVMPDYRLYPQVTFPAFVEDGALAVRWAHNNAGRFGGDPSRLYLMGHSAGAHIAVLLTLDASYLKSVGLDRSAIRATAGLSGPYDFVPPLDDRGAFGMSRNDTTPNPRIEPIHFVDGHAPPLLLVHGLNDTTVGPENSTRLAERIRQAGGDVRTIFYPDRAHVGVVLSLAWPFRWLAPTLRDTTAFFREQEQIAHAPMAPSKPAPQENRAAPSGTSASVPGGSAPHLGYDRSGR